MPRRWKGRGKFFKHQHYHLLVYVLLGALVYFATVMFPGGQGRAWGLSTSGWMLFSWIFAGVFQAWILFFWRMELYFGKISAWMGKSGFLYFRVGFVTFGAARFFPLIPISLSSQDTSSIPRSVSAALIVVTTPLIIWTLYSVFFYFGVTRTFGADHFDPAYRSGKLEKRGVFKYIPNAMYTFGFLLFYHPALFWQSRLGLMITVAHHAFVWTAYFCTEKPDMKEICGQGG